MAPTDAMAFHTQHLVQVNGCTFTSSASPVTPRYWWPASSDLPKTQRCTIVIHMPAGKSPAHNVSGQCLLSQSM